MLLMKVKLKHMGVSKNSGTPKWMVYKGKPYEQMDDLGVYTPIFGNTHMIPIQSIHFVGRNEVIGRNDHHHGMIGRKKVCFFSVIFFRRTVEALKRMI